MIMRDLYISPGANRCAECRTLGGGENSLASQPFKSARSRPGPEATLHLRPVRGRPEAFAGGKDGGTLLRLLQDDQLAPQETGGLR